MRTPIAAGLVLTGLVLVGCGGRRAVEIDSDGQLAGNRWTATLATPANLVGALQVKGTGWMGPGDGDDSSSTSAGVSISNSAPGGRHPWHVHVGRCGQDRGIFGPAGEYPLLEVGGDGEADADVDLPVPLPMQGQYFIDVHASPSNMGTIVACGNLAPPSR